MLSSINSLKKVKMAALGLVGSLFIVSCGSYQAVNYDNDGIYGVNNQNNRQVTPVNTPAPVPTANPNSYFTQKLQEYENATSGGEVLTDIENYSSQGYDQNQADYANDSYAGWGQNTQQTTQVYANVGWGWGVNNYYPFWNRGFRNGWNNWGWRGGWNNWGWNNWGYGWNDPFFYGGFYGGGFWGNNLWYGNGFYGNRWNNGFYGNRRFVNNRNNVRGTNRNYTPRYSGSRSSARSSSSRNSSGSSTRTYSPRQSSSVRSSNSSSRSSRSYSGSNSGSSNRSYSPRSSSSRSSSSARSSRSSSSRSSGGSYRRR